MFTVEAMQPLYHEERIKAAKASNVTSCASTPDKTSVATEAQQSPPKSQGPCAKTLAAALNRQQTATRPTGFFGATFRTLSGTATPSITRTTTPAREKTQAEIEALIAEKKRDADIVSRFFGQKFSSHMLTVKPSAPCPLGKPNATQNK
jgi:hypothetical protein